MSTSSNDDGVNKEKSLVKKKKNFGVPVRSLAAGANDDNQPSTSSDQTRRTTRSNSKEESLVGDYWGRDRAKSAKDISQQELIGFFNKLSPQRSSSVPELKAPAAAGDQSAKGQNSPKRVT